MTAQTGQTGQNGQSGRTDNRRPPHPRRLSARDTAMVAVFAGVVAALGVVPPIAVTGSAVPITAQSMGVMLAGAILGARRGFWSLLLFVALVTVGLPLLSGGVGGLGVYATGRVGFLLGFPFAAYAVGWLAERSGSPYRLIPGLAGNVVGGILVLYAFGTLGLATVGRLGLAEALVGLSFYLPGDLAKAVLAAFVARGVHAAYPGLLRDGRR